ncbi:hypothetical protein [Dietzia lutea]|uniref:hypothetical protein n=1 Tax=Dietzia lutea TaxID=546160 RepID=UPI001FC90D1C|nr:hypothetical protein [Dietzia lutea]
MSLVVGGGQVGPLRARGMRTVADLAEAGPDRPADWNGEPYSDAVLRARWCTTSSRCSTRPTAPTPRDWRWCAVSWTPRPAGSANAAPARGGRGGRTGTGPSRGVAAGWSCPMT